ncbi:MAG TPA: hypothetical protein VKI23_06155 [Cellulomonadaceae bacterium]|nr:hypothetical protein [Cellulomonadaceae bacterium]
MSFTQGPLGAPDPRMLYVSDAVNFDTMVSRRTSRVALVGFICSLVWIFGILSLVGLGLSIAGIYDTRGGKHAGRSFAVFGIIVGVLGLAATTFIVISGRSST